MTTPPDSPPPTTEAIAQYLYDVCLNYGEEQAIAEIQKQLQKDKTMNNQTTSCDGSGSCGYCQQVRRVSCHEVPKQRNHSTSLESFCPKCGGSGGEYPTCTICGTLKAPRPQRPQHVNFRLPRRDLFSPTPARREWEKKNGKQLQAIDRYEDFVTDEIVWVYEVIQTSGVGA